MITTGTRKSVIVIGVFYFKEAIFWEFTCPLCGGITDEFQNPNSRKDIFCMICNTEFDIENK